MTYHPSLEVAETRLAECTLIATYAYERFIDVSPIAVNAYIAQWRLWYYHMISDDAVLALPGARRVPPSGR